MTGSAGTLLTFAFVKPNLTFADPQSFGGNLQNLQSNFGIHKLPGSQDAAQRGDAGRDE